MLRCARKLRVARPVLWRGMTTPASPCTGVCTIDPASALCRGCARTMAEIAAWYRAKDQEKRAILVRCEKRLASAVKAP
jgi:predicted Fe-S protein YdhL (DUF1289 family)